MSRRCSIWFTIICRLARARPGYRADFDCDALRGWNHRRSFEWVSQEAIAGAHANPAVLDLWKRFEAVCCIRNAVQDLRDCFDVLKPGAKTVSIAGVPEPKMVREDVGLGPLWAAGAWVLSAKSVVWPGARGSATG